MTQDKNIGQVFGIYTILGVHSERHRDGHLLYECRCNICHEHFVRKLSDIKKRNKVCQHQHHIWRNKRISGIFYNMIDRCYNPDAKDYRWYGAKGIRVCEEWINNPNLFEQWAFENGYEDTLTIDRIHSDQNYNPENCRWISLAENVRRAGRVNWITVDDVTLTGRQWAEKLGLGILTINKYIHKYGLDLTIELIRAMLKEVPSTKHRKSHQTWFSVYNIEII